MARGRDFFAEVLNKEVFDGKLTNRQARDVIDSMLTLIVEEAKKDALQFRGFGTFRVVGKSPKVSVVRGKKYQIPARNRLQFKQSKGVV